MKAVFYVPTAHIGGRNEWDINEGRSAVDLLNESELLELHQNGMEIGGHSHHHIHLGRVDATALRNEVTTCQTILTKIIGQPSSSFAFPYGSLPVECIGEAAKIFQESFFHDACGIFCPRETRLQRRRFIVHDDDSSLTMRVKLSKVYALYRSIRDSRKPSSSFV
jgi:peptidoglycan/xylan/chitin deacetylase (PgdA/CDA1 family)